MEQRWHKELQCKNGHKFFPNPLEALGDWTQCRLSGEGSHKTIETQKLEQDVMSTKSTDESASGELFFSASIDSEKPEQIGALDKTVNYCGQIAAIERDEVQMSIDECFSDSSISLSDSSICYADADQLDECSLVQRATPNGVADELVGGTAIADTPTFVQESGDLVTDERDTSETDRNIESSLTGESVDVSKQMLGIEEENLNDSSDQQFSESFPFENPDFSDVSDQNSLDESTSNPLCDDNLENIFGISPEETAPFSTASTGLSGVTIPEKSVLESGMETTAVELIGPNNASEHGGNLPNRPESPCDVGNLCMDLPTATEPVETSSLGLTIPEKNVDATDQLEVSEDAVHTVTATNQARELTDDSPDQFSSACDKNPAVLPEVLRVVLKSSKNQPNDSNQRKSSSESTASCKSFAQLVDDLTADLDSGEINEGDVAGGTQFATAKQPLTDNSTMSERPLLDAGGGDLKNSNHINNDGNKTDEKKITDCHNKINDEPHHSGKKHSVPRLILHKVQHKASLTGELKKRKKWKQSNEIEERTKHKTSPTSSSCSNRRKSSVESYDDHIAQSKPVHLKPKGEKKKKFTKVKNASRRKTIKSAEIGMTNVPKNKINDEPHQSGKTRSVPWLKLHRVQHKTSLTGESKKRKKWKQSNEIEERTKHKTSPTSSSCSKRRKSSVESYDDHVTQSKPVHLKPKGKKKKKFTKKVKNASKQKAIKSAEIEMTNIPKNHDDIGCDPQPSQRCSEPQLPMTDAPSGDIPRDQKVERDTKQPSVWDDLVWNSTKDSKLQSERRKVRKTLKAPEDDDPRPAKKRKHTARKSCSSKKHFLDTSPTGGQSLEDDCFVVKTITPIAVDHSARIAWLAPEPVQVAKPKVKATPDPPLRFIHNKVTKDTEDADLIALDEIEKELEIKTRSRPQAETARNLMPSNRIECHLCGHIVHMQDVDTHWKTECNGIKNR